MSNYERNIIDRVFSVMDNLRLFHGGGRMTGCNNRAHLGGAMLQMFGLKARKVWLFGEGYDHRKGERSSIKCPTFRLPESGLCPYNNFHVIPAAVTKDGRHVLIDPMFYDAPISLFQATHDFRQVANDEPAQYKVTRLNAVGIFKGGEPEIVNIPTSVSHIFESVLCLREMLAEGLDRDDLQRIRALEHDIF